MHMNKLFALVALALLVLGCSDKAQNEEYQIASYTEGGQLYCIASSGSRINIADIVDGGECGEAFAKQGDLYANIGGGSSFLVPPQAPDCVTQVAYSVDADGPTFLFVVHSLGEDGVEILKPEKPTIPRNEFRRDSTCLIDFWVLSGITEGDLFEIRLTDHTIPIMIGDITSGAGAGTSSLTPLGDELLIGRPVA